ncbi:phage tail assembly protein [Lysinibacillus fusiformis]|uniref:phage tail assembly protein n=1 Tax=Lysinibacillus TaxID=400634 RepID=UPI00056422BD|nr:phage tail assembly protein [Lysinibacillus sphaericus]QTB24325.1 phage tail assembly protein [Lysinibacillus sphaericus]
MEIKEQNVEEKKHNQKQEKENEVENKNPEIIIVPIKRPIEIDGTFLNEVKLDFTEMTGTQILNIDAELRKEGTSFDDLWNQTVILKLMSRVSGIFEDDLRRLHGADYLEVAFRTRNFFIQW